jgi:hypothetical protein
LYQGTTEVVPQAAENEQWALAPEVGFSGLTTESGIVPAGAKAHVNSCGFYGTTEVVP